MPGAHAIDGHNDGVPFRLAAAVVLAALALSACSNGTGSAAKTPTQGVRPTPSSTVSTPPGEPVTDPGTHLSFGGSATVAYPPHRSDPALLGLSVDSARKASLRDLAGFELDDPYKKDASYYYVEVTVRDLGGGHIGGRRVPLWGVSDANVLLQPVEFVSRFTACPSKRLPKRFAKGDKLSTCLVYLSPNHGELVAVSYRPDQSVAPIQWTGTVASPSARPGKKHKKSS
jgi:hypothetical protein